MMFSIYLSRDQLFCCIRELTFLLHLRELHEIIHITETVTHDNITETVTHDGYRCNIVFVLEENFEKEAFGFEINKESQ